MRQAPIIINYEILALTSYSTAPTFQRFELASGQQCEIATDAASSFQGLDPVSVQPVAAQQQPCRRRLGQEPDVHDLQGTRRPGIVHEGRSGEQRLRINQQRKQRQGDLFQSERERHGLKPDHIAAHSSQLEPTRVRKANFQQTVPKVSPAVREREERQREAEAEARCSKQ